MKSLLFFLAFIVFGIYGADSTPLAPPSFSTCPGVAHRWTAASQYVSGTTVQDIGSSPSTATLTSPGVFVAAQNAFVLPDDGVSSIQLGSFSLGGAFTVAYWFRVDTAATQRFKHWSFSCASGVDAGSSSPCPFLEASPPTNAAGYWFFNNNNNANQVCGAYTTTFTLSGSGAGVWSHRAVTMSASGFISMYNGGSLDMTTCCGCSRQSTPFPLTQFTDPRIMRHSTTGGGGQFSIADFQVYTWDLSAAAISSLSLGSTENCPPSHPPSPPLPPRPPPAPPPPPPPPPPLPPRPPPPLPPSPLPPSPPPPSPSPPPVPLPAVALPSYSFFPANASAAFDGTPATTWTGSVGETLFISYAPSLQVLSYSVISGSGAPCAWELGGSADNGTTWFSLDTRPVASAALLPPAIFTKNITGVFNAFSFQCTEGPCSLAELSFAGQQTLVTVAPAGSAGDRDNETSTSLDSSSDSLFIAMPSPGTAYVSQYVLIPGSQNPPGGWTLSALIDGAWTIISTVPSFVSLPQEPLTIAVEGFPLVSAIRFNCTSACTVAELSIGILPLPLPPQISAPTYTSEAYFGSIRTVTSYGTTFAGEFFSVAYNVTVLPTNYTISTATVGHPLAWALLGSLDGVNFVSLDLQDPPASLLPPSTDVTFDLSDASGWSLFRLVCLSAQGPSCWISSFSVAGEALGPAQHTSSLVQQAGTATSSGIFSSEPLLSYDKFCQ